MTSRRFAIGVEKVRAALGEPPQAKIIVCLMERPLQSEELAHTLFARGVAASWLSEVGLADVLRQLTADGTIRQRSTGNGHGAYELTGPGRDRAGIIDAVFGRLAW